MKQTVGKCEMEFIASGKSIVKSGIRVNQYACESEEVAVQMFLTAARSAISDLTVYQPIYGYMEDDMKLLAYVMFHEYDFSEVFFSKRKVYDGLNDELAIYVGHAGERFYLWELLGAEAAEALEEAKVRYEEKQKRLSEYAAKKDPGYEEEPWSPEPEESEDGREFDNLD